jgi:hypothetical protein
VLPAFLTGGCSEPRARFDGDGALHVVSTCRLFDDVGPGEPGLYDAVRTAGTWHEPAALPDNDGGGKSLAAGGPDGALHVAWVETCPGFNPDDGEVPACLYHSVYRGGAFSPPVKAYEVEGTLDLFPSGLAVDQDGRVLIAFSHTPYFDRPGQYLGDVSLTESTDGVSFSEPCDLTRTADIDDEDAVVRFDAETGEAHIIVTSVTQGDDDYYRYDLVHARLP